MNKISQLFFLSFFPFLPFWARLLSLFTGRPIEMLLILISIPIVFYFLLSPKINLPGYLVLFILFTFYHISSTFISNPAPSLSFLIWLLLLDKNVLACLLFFIIENTHFDEKFIRALNRNIFIIVVISLFVSLIQIRYPAFFVSPKMALDPDLIYSSENRIFSIYTWVDLNSIGVTFPILIAILLGLYSNNKSKLPAIAISGIVVSFLTKARYVMLSAIIVFSQLFITNRVNLTKKVYIFLIFIGSIVLLLGAAKAIGYDVQQVIDDRILEKSTKMANFNTRILSFYVFLAEFPKNPLFGVGPETKMDVIRSLGGEAPLIHIGYLSYLYFYGLAGSFLLFLSMFLMLKNAYNVGKKHKFWGGFYGLLSFSVANATMVYFNFSEMGIVLVIMYLRYFNEKSSYQIDDTKLKAKFA